jgi:SAM-dependent methyltransferase
VSSLPFPFALDATHAYPPVRELFTRIDYTVSGVTTRLGIGAMHDFTPEPERAVGDTGARDALDVAIRLLLDAATLPATEVTTAWGAQACDAMHTLGLLEPSIDGAAVRATVSCYPLDGLWLASDFSQSIRRGEHERADVVYPAMTANSRRFLDGLPPSRCERFLELCGGTGAAALLAARAGAAAWTTDIAERSTHFAVFNMRLNGITGCEARTGDLYDAVPGARFDRIAAHPPYVATPTNTMIFRDGGEDGEAVTRRIVAGLPTALAPGGRCYLTCMATDRSTAPLELRLREWLGPTADDFDVHLFMRTAFTPQEYYKAVASTGELTDTEADQWTEYFVRLDVTLMIYCWIVIVRHDTPRPPITRRRIRRTEASQSEIEAILKWEEIFEDPAAEAAMRAARPALLPGVRLAAVLRQGQSTWVPEAAVLECSSPLPARVEVEPVVAGIASRFDGTRTVAEHFDEVRERRELAADAPIDNLLALVRQLLSAGMLTFAA